MSFVQGQSAFPKRSHPRITFQTLPYAQTKNSSRSEGKKLDVAVDLRKGKTNFGSFFQSSCLLKRQAVLSLKDLLTGFPFWVKRRCSFIRSMNIITRSWSRSFARNPQLGWLDGSRPHELISEKEILLPPYNEHLAFFEQQANDKEILVTGGADFIGSNFIPFLWREPRCSIR